MRCYSVLKLTLWGLLLGMVALLPAFAQDCPALVQQALNAVGDNCQNMARNTACYGYADVIAAFATEVTDNFFSQPADRADLTTLVNLKTAPLDLESGTWGVAVMSVQGNVPNTLPGQAVTFVLMGDVEVENAVTPEKAQLPPPPLTVTVRTNANIRSGAGTNFNVLGGAAAGATFAADVRDERAQWVRIAYNNRLAWISRSVLQDDPLIDTLPVNLDEFTTPMQAFYLRTGIGKQTCNEAPDSVLLIQGRKGMEIRLTLNGAEVVMGSTGLFRTLNDDTQLEVITLDGSITLTTSDGDKTTIGAGQRSVFCLSDPDNLGADGQSNDRTVSCGGTPPERVSRDSLEAWCALRRLPAEPLLSYERGARAM